MSDFQVRFPFRWIRINPHKPDRDKTFKFLTSDGASVGWNRGYLLSHLSDYYKPKITGDLRELISDLSNDFQVITDAIVRYIFSGNIDSFSHFTFL